MTTDLRGLVDQDAVTAANAKHAAVLARLPRAEALLAAAHEAAKTAEAAYNSALRGEGDSDVFALSNALSTAADRVQIAETHVAAVQKAVAESHIQLEHDIRNARLPVAVAAVRARLLLARRVDVANRELAAAKVEAAQLQSVFAFAGWGNFTWGGPPESFASEAPVWRDRALRTPLLAKMMAELESEVAA